MKRASENPENGEMRHGDVILTLQWCHGSTCGGQRAAGMWLFVFIFPEGWYGWVKSTEIPIWCARMEIYHLSYRLHGQELDVVDSSKYLGMKFTSDITWPSRIAYVGDKDGFNGKRHCARSFPQRHHLSSAGKPSYRKMYIGQTVLRRG